MKILSIVMLILVAALRPCMAEDTSADRRRIEEDVDKMLGVMRGKFSIHTHVDRIVGYGDSAVPVLIDKYGETAEEKRWALVNCLCRLPTPESRQLLMTVIQQHADAKSTNCAIRHYPDEYQSDMVELLIEVLPIREYGLCADDRLRKIVFQKPTMAGKLVEALVDDAASAPKNSNIHEVLAYVSGYAHSWRGRGGVKRTPVSENGFWRDWWKRNESKEVFDWLIEALYEESGRRWSNALGTLGCLKDKRAIPHFVSALDDEQHGVRYWAVVGLKKIEGTHPQNGYLSETFEVEEDEVIAGLKVRFGNKTDNKRDTGDGK